MSDSHWHSDMNLPRPAETIVRPFTTFPCLWCVIKVPRPNHKRCSSSSRPLMWRFAWPQLPSTLFWAKRRGKQTARVSENTTYQSHQKGPGKQPGRLEAWDKHTHKSLRFPFTCVALRPGEGLVYAAACALQRVKPNSFSARTQTSKLVCSLSDNVRTWGKKAQSGTSVPQCTMWHKLFSPLGPHTPSSHTRTQSHH